MASEEADQAGSLANKLAPPLHKTPESIWPAREQPSSKPLEIRHPLLATQAVRPHPTRLLTALNNPATSRIQILTPSSYL